MYLGMLTWPLIALGWVINLFQRGAASTTRLLDILDARSRLDGAGVAARAAAVDRRTHDRVSERRVPLSRGAPDSEPRWVLRDISLHGAGRRDDRRRRRDGERQERADGSDPALLRSAGRGRSSSTAYRFVTSTSRRCDARSATSRRRASCSATRSAATSSTAPTERRRRAVGGGDRAAGRDDRRVPRRVRHRARRARHQPVRRAEAARRAGPRAGAAAEHRAARRRAVGRRHAHRGGDPAMRCGRRWPGAPRSSRRTA